jgi:N-acetylglutamate synthase-like GNAT family acetyltransferase
MDGIGLNKVDGVLEYRRYESVSLAELDKAYSSLLFPPPLSQTQGKPLYEPLSCIVAVKQMQPVGLILWELRERRSLRVICWCVLAEYRNKGIGTALLRLLENTARGIGAKVLVLTFRSDLAYTKIVRKILENHAWSSPQMRLKLYKVTRKSFREPAWFSRIKLPKDYSIFPWRDLSIDDRRGLIERQNQTGWYPNALTPFQEESKIEWSNSLGLRHKGDITGWLITHRVAADVIQYSALFVSPENKPLSIGLPLIVEAVRRQCDTKIDRAIFQVRSENRRFLEFIEHRLSDVLESSAERLLSKKEIG